MRGAESPVSARDQKELPRLAPRRQRSQNICWVSVHKSRTAKPLKPRIGELLLSEGKLSEAVLTKALRLQNQDGKGTRLGAILLKWDLVPEQVLLEALSRYHHCPSADRDALVAADKKAVSLLSAEQATRLGAMPYAFEDKAVRVAFENPSNLADVDEVKAITGRKVLPAVTSQVRLVQAHQRFYRRAVSLDLWSVVQKLERKAAAPPPIPQPPPDFSAPQTETYLGEAPSEPGANQSESSAPAAAEAVSAAAGAAPGEPADEFGTMGVATIALSASPLAAAAVSSSIEEPDPFSDECPLTKFVEDALAFFSQQSDLAAVLEDLAEPIEDLDPSTEEVTDYPAPPHAGGESTMPRPRPRSQSGLSY
jgi:hypothetical protein